MKRNTSTATTEVDDHHAIEVEVASVGDTRGILRALKEDGPSPFYLYDRNLIREALDRRRNAERTT
jgi:hypothetical protein